VRAKVFAASEAWGAREGAAAGVAALLEGGYASSADERIAVVISGANTTAVAFDRERPAARAHTLQLARVAWRDSMADVELTAAFSTVPAAEQEAIRRVLVETVEQLAREDASFKRAKLVFTESDERCALTAELDGVKREGVPLQIEIEQLEDAQSGAGARAQLKEAIRLYFRRVQGR